jgi:hypothetical protein
VWVIVGHHSTGSMHGYWLFEAWSRLRIRHDEVWYDQANDSGGCRRGIRSRVFARKRPSAGCSVIQMCGSSLWNGAQKNRLRLLRAGADELV